MKLQIIQEDPLHILTTTKPIVENLQHITINEAKLTEVAKHVNQQMQQGLDSLETGYGSTGNYIDDVQLIFLEDVVKFCFWAEKDKPRWQVTWPKGEVPTGGWYSLIKCFQRALAEKIPILDAKYLSSITLEQTRNIFRGSNDVNIPLLQKRMENLQEAGKVLKEKFAGKFLNALTHIEYDAINIVQLVYDNFPSFRDTAVIEGKEIFFLKRAQIVSQDLSYLTKKYENIKISNLNLLTAFADYKLPQMLRKYGAVVYNKELGEKVDKYVLIPAGSREEIEIRAVTIWCIELLRQQLQKYTAGEIDNVLWLISQNQSNIQPYHRTYTVFY